MAHGPIAACAEGVSRPCHERVGEHEGVVTCVVGEQACVAGEYGPCVGALTAAKSIGVAQSGSGVAQPLAFVDAGACVSNPCDPSCMAFDETPDGGVGLIGIAGGSYQSGSVASIPAGFWKKGAPSPCEDVDDDDGNACQYDQDCNAGTCTPWAFGAKDPSCIGVDLTVGIPCTGNIPVCNRGNALAPAGVTLNVYAGASAGFGACTPGAWKAKGRCVVPSPIAAGSCVDVTAANCSCGLSGNEALMVNPKGSVPECACDNNWSDYHAGGCTTTAGATYASKTVTETFTASCPEGTRAQWGYLAYSVTAPSDSRVTFRAHTGDTATSLAPATRLVGVAKASPLPNTTSCELGGAAGCPMDLFTALGGLPAARQNVLELVTTLEPSTDGTSAPTLTHYQVTYACPFTE